MEREQLKRIVEVHLPGMMRGLCVSHWELVVKYDRLDQGDVPKNFVRKAQVEKMPQYTRAFLTMDWDAFETEEDVLETLRHELIHLFHGDVDLYRDTAWEGQADLERKALDVVWNHGIERLVGGIEQMLTTNGLTGRRLAEVGSVTEWKKIPKLKGKKRA